MYMPGMYASLLFVLQCDEKMPGHMQRGCTRVASARLAIFVYSRGRLGNAPWVRITQIAAHWCCVKGEGKAIPLQAWTVPEGSRRLRLPDFKTIDTGRLYPPGNIPGTHFCWGAR
jgi:hypothetical protein